MGCFCMLEKKKQKTYTGKFKVEAVETMRNENLSYKETARRFGLAHTHHPISYLYIGTFQRSGTVIRGDIL